MSAGNTASLSVIMLMAIGCGSPGGSGNGALNGTWQQTGMTCNGTAKALEGAATLVFNDASGSISFPETSTCTVKEALTISYPAANQVTLQHSGNHTCTPSGCASKCASAQTPDGDETFTFTLSGTTLKVSTTQVGTDGECADGQTVEHTLAKQ